MTTIDLSIKLSEVLRLVSKPRYVLGTTYTLSLAFFESVVFPFIDRSNLKSCLILCDMDGFQRALTEAAALQSTAQDYIGPSIPRSGAFILKSGCPLAKDERRHVGGKRQPHAGRVHDQCRAL